MRVETVLLALAVGALAACAPGIHLERSAGESADLDDLQPCVRAAYAQVKAGKRELSAEQQRALGDRDVSGFLDWSSPSGPRPVVRDGRPAELESKLPFAGDRIVTQRYVLCLLKHGYRWPTPDEPDTDG